MIQDTFTYYVLPHRNGMSIKEKLFELQYGKTIMFKLDDWDKFGRHTQAQFI